MTEAGGIGARTEIRLPGKPSATVNLGVEFRKDEFRVGVDFHAPSEKVETKTSFDDSVAREWQQTKFQFLELRKDGQNHVGPTGLEKTQPTPLADNSSNGSGEEE